MDFIQGESRDQLFMMDLESFVAPDSWARIVDWFVDALPMNDLGFNEVHADEGRPPYKASDLLKLFMYGYKKGLRSSRKLEEACRINIEVMWLMSCYNLSRITSILGIEILKSYLKELYFQFIVFMESFRALLSNSILLPVSPILKSNQNNQSSKALYGNNIVTAQ